METVFRWEVCADGYELAERRSVEQHAPDLFLIRNRSGAALSRRSRESSFAISLLSQRRHWFSNLRGATGRLSGYS